MPELRKSARNIDNALITVLTESRPDFLSASRLKTSIKSRFSFNVTIGELLVRLEHLRDKGIVTKNTDYSYKLRDESDNGSAGIPKTEIRAELRTLRKEILSIMAVLQEKRGLDAVNERDLTVDDINRYKMIGLELARVADDVNKKGSKKLTIKLLNNAIGALERASQGYKRLAMFVALDECEHDIEKFKGWQEVMETHMQMQVLYRR